MDQRSVVITGAGSGIGKAITKRFLDAGDHVYATDISQDRLNQVAQELGSPECLQTVVADVSEYADLQNVANKVVSNTSRLDVWVNCAGIFDGYADILETTPELWDKVIGINLTGAFYGARSAAEVMTKQGSGRIITIGSVAGQRGAADGLSYAASKAGIEGMTRRLAVDVGKHGITANVIAPGVIKTALRATSEEILGDLVSDQQRGIGTSSQEYLDSLIPAQRSGLTTEIAATVHFLASEEAGYVNGQVLAVDGGWTAG